MNLPRPACAPAVSALAALLIAAGLNLSASADTPPAAVTRAAATAVSPAAPAGTVAASPAPAAPTTAAPAVSTAKPKLICEDETEIGSHFRRRICMSPEQAAARRKAAQDAFRNRSSTQSCNESGCSGGAPPP